MTNWIFISSTKRFRMNDWLSLHDCVEYYQRNKVQVNDIVYLYTTSPICRIEYKMIVEKINIPFECIIDDSEYALHKMNNNLSDMKDKKYFRLKLLKKTNNPNLHLDFLRNHGLKSSMQSPFKIEGELLDYIEEQFKQY